MKKLDGQSRGSPELSLVLSFQGRGISGSNLSYLLAVGCPFSFLPLRGPSWDASSTEQEQGSISTGVPP